VGGLSYKSINAVLSMLALGGDSNGYRVTTVIDADDCWLATWANDGLYAIVQASQYDKEHDKTLIEVCAGGGYGAQPHVDLFQTIATSAGAHDFGGPWARVMNDGTVAYGWRNRLPSELFTEENKGDSFSFVLAMVDDFGQAAAELAAQLVPRHGGSRCSDVDPQAWPGLLAGILTQPA
jgi:hypothetical protein